MTRGRRLAFFAAAVLFAMSVVPVSADFPGAVAGAIDWLRPTGGPYPRLEAGARLWVKVSLERQRVYIMDGGKSVYTMIASTGLDTPPDDRTPEGTFYVQRERGLSFYSSKAGEGARYWIPGCITASTSSIRCPSTKRGDIILDEARKLGNKASHGCIRLSLADAKWVYDNIPYSTKVVIGR